MAIKTIKEQFHVAMETFKGRCLRTSSMGQSRYFAKLSCLRIFYQLVVIGGVSQYIIYLFEEFYTIQAKLSFYSYSVM